MKTPIPNTLKEYRNKMGLRQMDVASKLGFSSAERISLWEKGRAAPNLLNLFKLCGLYQVLPHELYGDYLVYTTQKIFQINTEETKRD